MADDTSTDKDLKKVEIDGEAIERFSPKEQREQESHEIGDQSRARPGFGAMYQKIVPPGTG